MPLAVATGLARRLASLANSFLRATPTPQESDSSAATRSRSPNAISAGVPRSATEPVTSKKASSRPSDSTRGVAEASTSWKDRESSS